jgi:hypothetical protein
LNMGHAASSSGQPVGFIQYDSTARTGNDRNTRHGTFGSQLLNAACGIGPPTFRVALFSETPKNAYMEKSKAVIRAAGGKLDDLDDAME